MSGSDQESSSGGGSSSSDDEHAAPNNNFGSKKTRHRDHEEDRIKRRRRHIDNSNTKSKRRTGQVPMDSYTGDRTPGDSHVALLGLPQQELAGGRIGRTPTLSVGTTASLSSLSHAGSNPYDNGVHVSHSSEISAVREYVRSEIYPKKKTIFCDQELMYGSPLANTVIQYICYENEGYYRWKKAATYAGIKAIEVGFWTRNQETVRRVLKEKVNNSLSRFKEKLESKCCCWLWELLLIEFVCYVTNGLILF